MTDNTPIVMKKQVEPYFYENEMSLINSSYSLDHLDYIEQSFEDDDDLQKERRIRYTTLVNFWLNASSISDVTRYFHLFDKDTYTEINNKTFENTILTRNKEYVERFYNDIKSILKECDLNLSDENQFKEDFIYFMYKLSDISHI